MAAAVLGPLPATKLRNATRVGEDGPVQGPALLSREERTGKALPGPSAPGPQIDRLGSGPL